MAEMHVKFEDLPPNLQWFFHGQFVLREALERGYKFVANPYIDDRGAVVVHHAKAIVVSPTTYKTLQTTLPPEAFRA